MAEVPHIEEFPAEHNTYVPVPISQPQSLSFIHPVTRILREVAAKHCMTSDDLCSRRKSFPLAAARLEAWLRCLGETTASYSDIARRSGHNHSTVHKVVAKYCAMTGDAHPRPPKRRRPPP